VQFEVRVRGHHRPQIGCRGFLACDDIDVDRERVVDRGAARIAQPQAGEVVHRFGEAFTHRLEATLNSDARLHELDFSRGERRT
jgi:hypothetical protein